MGSGSFLMYFQGMNFVTYFIGSIWAGIEVSICFSACWSKKIPKQSFGTLNLPDNKNTWRMDHFWFSCNGWTWCHVYRQPFDRCYDFYGIFCYYDFYGIFCHCSNQPFLTTAILGGGWDFLNLKFLPCVILMLGALRHVLSNVK